MFILEDGSPSDILSLFSYYLQWKDMTRLSLAWKNGRHSLPSRQNSLYLDSNLSILLKNCDHPFEEISLLIRAATDLEAFLDAMPRLCTSRLRSLRLHFQELFVYGRDLPPMRLREQAPTIVRIISNMAFPALELFALSGFPISKDMVSLFPKMMGLRHIELSSIGTDSYDYEDEEEQDEMDTQERVFIISELAKNCTLLESVSLDISNIASRQVLSKGVRYAEPLKNLKHLRSISYSGAVGYYFEAEFGRLFYGEIKPNEESILIRKSMEWATRMSPPEQNCTIYVSGRREDKDRTLLYHALSSTRPAYVSAVFADIISRNEDISQRPDIIRWFRESFSLNADVLQLLAQAGFDFGIIHPDLPACPLEIVLNRQPSKATFDWIFRNKCATVPGSDSAAKMTPFQQAMLRYPKFGPFSDRNVITVVASAREAPELHELLEYLASQSAQLEEELGVLIGGPDDPNPSGLRPIHVARSASAVNFLISHAVDLYAKSPSGHTVWSLQAVDGNSQLKLLLEADCSCVDTPMSEIGGTMMHAACKLGLFGNVMNLHSNYARITDADLEAFFKFNEPQRRSPDLIRFMELAVKLPNNPKDAVPCICKCFETCWKSLNPGADSAPAAKDVMRKIVWTIDAELLFKLDEFGFKSLGLSLAQAYLTVQEPDLAKIVLKKLSENAEARKQVAQLWRTHQWSPLHAALTYQLEHPREVSEWREYVRFARTIGFDQMDKNAAGESVEQRFPLKEREAWLSLFSGAVPAPVVDPWAN